MDAGLAHVRTTLMDAKNYDVGSQCHSRDSGEREGVSTLGDDHRVGRLG